MRAERATQFISGDLIMGEKLRVAAVQMSSQDDLGANLARAAELIARAPHGGAGLVLHPQKIA
jgi:hypothetical protein